MYKTEMKRETQRKETKIVRRDHMQRLQLEIKMKPDNSEYKDKHISKTNDCTGSVAHYLVFIHQIKTIC